MNIIVLKLIVLIITQSNGGAKVKKVQILLIIILSFIVFLVSGCGKSEKDPNSMIDYLKSLDCYSADVKITIKNSKQKLVYNTRQVYSSDLGHILNINDERRFLFKEDKIYVKDLKNGTTYVQENEFDFIFKLSFIEEYIKMLYTNEKLEYSFENIDDKEYGLIHFIIPGVNRNIDKAVLYINNEDNIPYKVLIYDGNGDESVEINFENFNTNYEIDKTQFDVD